MYGRSGADQVYGGDQRDHIFGGGNASGLDLLVGNSHDDEIEDVSETSGDDSDYACGLGGDDTLNVDDQDPDDYAFGGDGSDTIDADPGDGVDYGGGCP